MRNISNSEEVKLAKKPVNKRTTLKEAVKENVNEGDKIGFTLFSNDPHRTFQEICRQEIGSLTLQYDSTVAEPSFLLGAGLVDKVEQAYNWGAIAGNDYVWRRVHEDGVPKEVEIDDYSNFGMGQRFWAGARGLPFMPIKSMLGSDIVNYNDNIKVIDDPYNGEPVALVPAANPDVALVHCQKADKLGNGIQYGLVGNSPLVAKAADRVILSCEELISTRETRSEHIKNVVFPHYIVDAVAEVPFGCHPREEHMYYHMDFPFLMDMHTQWETVDGFEEWMDEYVYGVETPEEYNEKVGWGRLRKLRQAEKKFQKPGMVL